MLRRIIIFIIFLLHIQFLCRNYFFDVSEGKFFEFPVEYLFKKDITFKSLVFSSLCALFFSWGYILVEKFNLNKKKYLKVENLPVFKIEKQEVNFIVLTGLFQVIISLQLLISTNFNYQLIAEYIEVNNFLFELRFFYLLPLIHILLNITLKDFISLPKLRWVRIVTLLYFLCIIFLQARSKLFEFLFIFIFSYLIQSRDIFKVKHIFYAILALIIPNIIILGRLGVPDDSSTLIDVLFSFEYSIIFNNALSAAIHQGFSFDKIFTFSDSLPLIIPSPIRSLLDITVVKSKYYADISQDAGLNNGGFSLLAEMFTNFGWLAPGVFFLFGSWLSFYIVKCKNNLGNINLRYSIAPILYSTFVLAFRNDFGVFIKTIITVQIIAVFISYFFKINSHGRTP